MTQHDPEARFIGYEYREVAASDKKASLWLDGYASFGWTPDERMPVDSRRYRLRRDRKLVNRAELTRLQRHFEACMREIQTLERAGAARARGRSLAVGLIGTAFMAGSTFAVTHEPPLIPLCVLLAIPGFAGWLLAPLVHRWVRDRQTAALEPLIEQKYDELYEVCAKGQALLR